MEQRVAMQRKKTIASIKRGKIILTEEERDDYLLSNELIDSIAEFIVNFLLNKNQSLIAD